MKIDLINRASRRDRKRAYEAGRYIGTCLGCGLVTTHLAMWQVDPHGFVLEHAACSAVWMYWVRLG